MGEGTLGIYESGGGVIGGLAAANDDMLIVVYDGSNVRYEQNGVVRRTIAAAPARTLFWDSSFSDPGAALKHIRFGALSANDWASIGNVNVQTGQRNPGGATDVDTRTVGEFTVTEGQQLCRKLVG